MTQAKPMVFTIIHGGEPHEVVRQPDGLVAVDGDPAGTARYIKRLTCTAASLGQPCYAATRRTLEEAATALAIWWLDRRAK